MNYDKLIENTIEFVRADAIAFMRNNIDCYEFYDEFYDDAFVSDDVCGNGPDGHDEPFALKTLMAFLLDDKHIDWCSSSDFLEVERFLGEGEKGRKYLDCICRIGILDFLRPDLVEEFANMKGVDIDDIIY